MASGLSFDERRVGVGTQGQQIFVRDYGSEHRKTVPLVCLSGFHRSGADFTVLAHALSSREDAPRRVLTIDFRGRGQSDLSDKSEPYAVSQDISDVNETLTALGITSAHIMGQSHGGLVAMGLAVSRPSVFASAILCDAGPEIDGAGLLRLRSNLDFIRKAGSWTEAMALFQQIYRKDYPNLSDERLAQLADRLMFKGKRGKPAFRFDKRLLKDLGDYSLDDGFATHWKMFDALNHVPLLLLKTELSDFISTSGYEAMLRRRPNARGYTILEQGSPALFEESETLGVIAAFLDQIS